MPFHEMYADGTPRPLLRGWLHGTATLVAVPLIYSQADLVPSPALPGLAAICVTLVLSSLVHLVPWKSSKVLEGVTRLDKTGILAICGTSFWGPQLLGSELCKPSFVISLCTVVIPVSLAALGTWCGLGPIVFCGCGIAMGSTLWFYGLHCDDNAFFLHSLACAGLYGVGLALYVLQVGGHRRYWGYHEWMHLLVTLGFLVNARGLWFMSQYTDETCMGYDYDAFVQQNSTMQLEPWQDILKFSDDAISLY